MVFVVVFLLLAAVSLCVLILMPERKQHTRQSANSVVTAPVPAAKIPVAPVRFDLRLLEGKPPVDVEKVDFPHYLDVVIEASRNGELVQEMVSLCERDTKFEYLHKETLVKIEAYIERLRDEYLTEFKRVDDHIKQQNTDYTEQWSRAELELNALAEQFTEKCARVDALRDEGEISTETVREIDALETEIAEIETALKTRLEGRRAHRVVLREEEPFRKWLHPRTKREKSSTLPGLVRTYHSTLVDLFTAMRDGKDALQTADHHRLGVLERRAASVADAAEEVILFYNEFETTLFHDRPAG